LRAIAVAGRPGDRLDELRPVLVPEARQLLVQPLVASGRDVVREATGQGRVVGEIALVVVAVGFLDERFAHAVSCALAYAVLAPIVDAFTEDLDTRDVADARAMLATLR